MDRNIVLKAAEPCEEVSSPEGTLTIVEST